MITDRDFSFIRLRDNLTDAFNLGESPTVENGANYGGQIQLLPNDPQPYVQISNSPTNVVIENQTVFLVDCFNGNETDITENVFIHPFTDQDGISQVVFEIIGIATDFGGHALYLRFESSGGQNYYSNRFLVTRDREELTTRFDYRHTGRYFGTDYFSANFRQSIRLNTYLDNYVSADEIDTYFQISRNQTISQRARVNDLNEYIFPYLNAWTAKRLKRLLYSNSVYIDQVRNYITDGFEMPARIENSNVAQATFLVDPDEQDTFTPDFQIFSGLTFTLNPLSGTNFNPTNGAALSSITVTFSENIVLNTDISGGIVNQTTMASTAINSGNSSVATNVLTIDTTGVFSSNATYIVTLNAGAISVSAFPVIESTAILNWEIIVRDGDWLAADWNNSDWFTN